MYMVYVVHGILYAVVHRILYAVLYVVHGILYALVHRILEAREPITLTHTPVVEKDDEIQGKAPVVLHVTVR